MDLNDYIKLHKAEDKPAEIAAIQKLYHEDRISQETNRAALKKHRAEAGQVAVTCKCGAESLLDAKRPEKAPKAKCGICGADLQ